MTVTVYSRVGCAACDATKKRLTRRGLEFVIVDVDEHPDALAVLRDLGFLSLPVVATDHDAWSGFQPERIDELAEYYGLLDISTPWTR